MSDKENMKKVTDLEKFVLEEVYRPYFNVMVEVYQPIFDMQKVYGRQVRIEKLDENYNLDNVIELLEMGKSSRSPW